MVNDLSHFLSGDFEARNGRYVQNRASVRRNQERVENSMSNFDEAKDVCGYHLVDID